MILSYVEGFLHDNSLGNRVVLQEGWVLPWTNAYPTFDLWCTLKVNAIIFHELAFQIRRIRISTRQRVIATRFEKAARSSG